MYRFVLYLHDEEKTRLVKLLEDFKEKKLKENEIDDDFLIMAALGSRLAGLERTFIA